MTKADWTIILILDNIKSSMASYLWKVRIKLYLMLGRLYLGYRSHLSPRSRRRNWRETGETSKQVRSPEHITSERRLRELDLFLPDKEKPKG